MLKNSLCFISPMLLLVSLSAQGDSVANREELLSQYGKVVYTAPAIHRVPDMDEGTIQALYYEALPYEEKPTRVFAYLGLPDVPAGTKVPGMVLAHGGGGTAFLEWVKVWTAKGFAAIAMDLEGNIPIGSHGQRPRHDFSGPSRTGMFDDEDKPRNQQWMYHAVADLMLANSLLRCRDEVDSERIGLTGISWGGVLSSLTAGVDDRFVFAAPVYGCGYLYDSKGYFNRMGAEDEVTLEKRKYWDPARFFSNAPMPMVWINGDNDPHFSVDTLSHSHVSAGPASTLSIHPRMPHGHEPGWEMSYVPEIYAVADYLLKGSGAPLARITVQPEEDGARQVVMHFESSQPIKTATLYYLDGPLAYAESEAKKHLDLVTPFEAREATLDANAGTVTATLPEGCTQYYINLIDDRGCIVSSELRTAK